MNRRAFLNHARTVGLGFAGLQFAASCGYLGREATSSMARPFGPLIPDPEGILDLPRGFTYQIVSRTGDMMSDGHQVPGRPDGMAAFALDNGMVALIRNHELNPDDDALSGLQGALPDRRAFYDFGRGRPALGGTSTVIYNTATRQVEQQSMSLLGTLRNCAGGATPWNSWLTCEEVVLSANNDRWERDHGYVFEVPATDRIQLASPEPIRAMGRFNHEAVAVDPISGCVYLTEDEHDGCLYRFIPKQRETLTAGGKLQAMAVDLPGGQDTRNWNEVSIRPSHSATVRWIDLDDVDNPMDDLRKRAQAKGAAIFARGEGMWFGLDKVYFACTNGGAIKKGQIWAYQPSLYEGQAQEAEHRGELTLFVESTDAGLLENADNLTVAPWGDLIVCEDGSGDQFLVGVQPDGSLYSFARNAISDSEFAGSTFSPDGSTLFVNIQHTGLTLAIHGPWPNRDRG